MKLLYGLTDDQMFDVYNAVWEQFHYDDVVNRIYENNYRQSENITDEEIQEATEYLKEICASYCDYASASEAAIDYVLAKRPKKEENKDIKTPCYYDQVLEMYGLTDGDAFRIKGHPHIYHFYGGDLLYSINFDDETSELSTYTLAQFLFAFKKEDIELILKPQPPDLLNETLKRIGLETHQGFLVDDDEYRGTTFYIDSFGDIYTNGEDEDVYHEYLTLGRILTQYPDKVIPMEGEKI